MTTAVEPQTKSVTLLTDRPGARFVIEGEDVIRNERGTVIGKHEGTVLQFRGATAVITEDRGKPGAEPRAFVNGTKQGWTFADLLRAIENHRLYNVRFWIDGEAPWDPRPNMAELREMVADASHDDLVAMYEEERSNHNRAVALTLIGDKLAAASGGDSGGSSDDLR